MKCLLPLLFLTVPCISGGQPHTPEERAKLTARADAAFEARDFSRALTDYLLLYQETKDGETLFRIAQCQRFLNQYTKASISYQGYLSQEMSSPRYNAVQEVIVEMKEKLEKQAQERRRAKRRNLLLSGGFLLLGGGVMIAATQQDDDRLAVALGSTAGLSLVLSGVFLTVALRPKPPLYTEHPQTEKVFAYEAPSLGIEATTINTRNNTVAAETPNPRYFTIQY